MRRMQHISAQELIERVLDPGSWRSWDTEVPQPFSVDPEYAQDLTRARERTGLDEAVLTGEGRIRGRRVAVAACEFAFLAGSIGVAAAERLVRAIERATAERLPLVASPTSGGTRMQEGTVAFLQMVKITAAIARHRAAGLPYLVYLRHPTMGGVLASWGSLGHVTAAQPGAMIGFLGPRVYEALHGKPFPPGVQVAENLYEHGLLDAVVAPEDLRDIAARALAVLCALDEPLPQVPDPDVEPHRDVPAWDAVTRSRRLDRPGVRALLKLGARDVIPLHGTGQGESEPGLLVALARFGVAPCVVLGQDRTRQSTYGPLGPAGLREARRGMRLAAELNLPLVTVIDTAGAALSREAEERGLAGEIARCLADLVMLPAPTVCVLLGEGAGGGALALLPADRVIAAQHGWLSPLPPEGASAILYRTTDRAAELAARQGVRAADLLAAGIVDRVVAECPDAAEEREAFLGRLARVLEYELVGLVRRDPDERLAARFARYRRLGLPE
ncbi:Acetyl-coenzyme A carboxyl transferase alpha chain [Carbonactinospora thermoautotrophica]|uniref:Acetyl-coenzyme A carboxyl transferase alpha chain n=2 Tax=Carbonactinospora thermoautotrophica TaxID=1469144 RepID=A0A132MT63_9ACTN|nr:Acetyl-coenzyme A carboxyl transferase alpha chain [Carbonactinospora thermoautotrophica]